MADEDLDADIAEGVRMREPAVDFIDVKTAGLRGSNVMNVMAELSGTIILPRVFDSRDDGREFLRLFLQYLPNHVPQRYGRDEPLKRRFRPADLDVVLDEWGPFDFIADRRDPEVYLQVHFSQMSLPQPRHAAIFFHRFEARDSLEVGQLEAFFMEAADRFGADLAVAHVLTRAEALERIDYLRTVPSANPDFIASKLAKQGLADTLGPMTTMQYTVPQRLKQYLPDLPWLTIFGKPYIEMFGCERLLATTAREVRQLSDRLVMMKVADGISDTPEGWAVYKEIRDRCKEHLDSNAFFDRDAPRDHIYNVPKFLFPAEMCRVKPVSGLA